MFSYIQLPKYRLIYDWSFSEVCDSGSELDLQRNCQAKGGKRALLWNHDSIAKEGRVSLFCPFQSPTCPWITQGRQKSSKEEAARAAGMGPWCLSLKHKKKVLAYTELLCLQLSLNTYMRSFFVFSFFCFFFNVRKCIHFRSTNFYHGIQDQVVYHTNSGVLRCVFVCFV